MSAQHTPGPWADLDIGEIVAGDDLDVVIAIMNDGGQSADCLTVEANARLIAAAPDLLAALEECATFLEAEFPWACDGEPSENCITGVSMCTTCQHSGCIRLKIDEARAAIAKATGGAA
jgi:hypothetical protein